MIKRLLLLAVAALAAPPAAAVVAARPPARTAPSPASLGRPHPVRAEGSAERAERAGRVRPSSAVVDAQATALSRDVEQAIESPHWHGDEWGVVVVSLDAGDTLVSRGAARELAPASNLKLFTTSTALHYLGPGYRYATYLAGTGPIRNGVLEGDLILYGTGDPTPSGKFYDPEQAAYEALADSLSALGVRRISGDVVGDASYFQGRPVGSGWEMRYVTHAYAAQGSALSYNDNVATLHVKPGDSVGAPPQVDVLPGGVVQLRNEARTVASGRSWIEVERAGYDAPIVVRGQIRRGHGSLWRAVPVVDPAHFAASVMRQLLTERGITVEGGARSVHDASASPITGPHVFAPALEQGRTVQVLAVHHSPPLIDIIRVINQRSHNVYAEAVLRTVGRVTSGDGSVDGGQRAVHALLKQVGGGAASMVRMDDGSGLSPLNRVTPMAVIDLLAYMARTPYYDDFLTTLPEAAHSRGLRRMQNTPAAGNLRAKTGTIDHVSALSGYVRARNGERLAFSIISNGVPSTWKAKRIEDRIGARLASFDRPVPVHRSIAAAPTAGATPDSAAGPAADTATRVASAESEPATDSAAESGQREPQPSMPATYTIRSGDTLDAIAKRYDITVAALRQANPDVNPRRLIPGRTIQLPTSAD